jgi:hypothetical protein
MKTKMKTILSVCMLIVLLYACAKDSVRPEPVLDCMGVENGVAVYDDCRDCQGAFLYNFTTHNPMDIVMLGGDTSGAAAANLATTDSIICVLPEHPMNSYWNSGCTDCDGVLNGVAVVDSCGDCQGAYIYNMVTHDPSEIVMLGGDTIGASATLTAGQVVILPNDPMNPYWNSGCK